MEWESPTAGSMNAAALSEVVGNRGYEVTGRHLKKRRAGRQAGVNRQQSQMGRRSCRASFGFKGPFKLGHLGPRADTNVGWHAEFLFFSHASRFSCILL